MPPFGGPAERLLYEEAEGPRTLTTIRHLQNLPKPAYHYSWELRGDLEDRGTVSMNADKAGHLFAYQEGRVPLWYIEKGMDRYHIKPALPSLGPALYTIKEDTLDTPETRMFAVNPGKAGDGTLFTMILRKDGGTFYNEEKTVGTVSVDSQKKYTLTVEDGGPLFLLMTLVSAADAFSFMPRSDRKTALGISRGAPAGLRPEEEPEDEYEDAGSSSSPRKSMFGRAVRALRPGSAARGRRSNEGPKLREKLPKSRSPDEESKLREILSQNMESWGLPSLDEVELADLQAYLDTVEEGDIELALRRIQEELKYKNGIIAYKQIWGCLYY